MKIVDITDNNIDAFVHNMPNNKKVFIAFLAPWCGHCQAFKSEWEDIKRQLRDEKKLVGEIVTMDDKMAEKLPLHVKKPYAFPTFSLYDGTHHIGDYTGGRNSADMIAFIKKNMSVAKKKSYNNSRKRRWKGRHSRIKGRKTRYSRKKRRKPRSHMQ